MNSSVPLQVMIADDSLPVRGLLRQIIESDPELRIAVTCVDGESAVADYKTYKPDIVLMDVEMPNMDGLTALQKILEFDENAKVIMCSSLTLAGVHTTYRALEIGALDCLAKPSSTTIDRGISFKDKLIDMLKSLGRGGNVHVHSTVSHNIPTVHRNEVKTTASSFNPMPCRPMPERLHSHFPVAMAIGASTGGPQALPDFLKFLDKNFLNIPIFITQHIPKGFADYLAEKLTTQTGLPVHVAQQDMLVQNGHVYLAPPEVHMGLTKGRSKTITLLDTPPVSFCKPSINIMLDSLREAYGSHLLTVLLTGMGSDGLEACQKMIKDSTQNIILAQDEESSVVWGIPGAVVKAGLAHAVLPPSELATQANKLLKGENTHA